MKLSSINTRDMSGYTIASDRNNYSHYLILCSILKSNTEKIE